MCADFGDPMSRDRELRHKKIINAILGMKIYYFAYNSKTTWRAQLKFAHNWVIYKWFMQTEFGRQNFELLNR